jgi:DNA-binding MarR family transcriptional regulator
MSQIVQNTAHQVLEAVPLVTRAIRAQLRRHRGADISVPQFRSMGYLDVNNGASLSDLASHIGLTMPSMSKLIDGLVSRGLVNRVHDSHDRRKVCLSLTPPGREQLRSAHRSTEKFLAERMSALPDDELNSISQAMDLLKRLFLRDQEPAAALQSDE